MNFSSVKLQHFSEAQLAGISYLCG